MRSNSYILRCIVLWLPVLIWAGIIFSFSSVPTAHVSEIHWKDFIVKKLAHITEYGIFAVLLYRALNKNGMERKNAMYSAIILCFMYGLTDEFHQSFTPGREPALRDVFFDTIGASLAMYLLWKLLPKTPKKLRSLLTKLQIE